MNSLIFLDIDGVLNHHEHHGNGYCGLNTGCVETFNLLLRETDARLVVTSAWRYLILTGQMTVQGFESLLLTHGVECHKRVIGCTRKDSLCFGINGPYPMDNERGIQISEWITQHNFVGRYSVIDDLDLGISRAGHPFVHCDGTVGLTVRQALTAKVMLNG